MANAIPVTQEPQDAKKVRKVDVQVPSTDANGVALPGDYVASVRENLGDPSDFHKKPKAVKVQSHDAFREDH
jgi:hypothetical protein